MKAIIELDDVPEFQIGQIVRVSFQDSAVMYGKCGQASGWVSVTDAMPEKDGQYLVCLNQTHLMVVSFAKKLEEVDREVFAGRDEPGWFEWDTEWCGFYEVTMVTHWMPIPKLPQEVSGDE